MTGGPSMRWNPTSEQWELIGGVWSPVTSAPWRRYTLSDGITGAVDGVNAVFGLPVLPDPQTTLVVFNGTVQPASSYTIDGNQITLSFTPRPASSGYAADTLEIFA